MTMDVNSEHSVKRFVKIVNYDENGRRVVVGQMDLFAHKECPSCHLMFNRAENLNCLKRKSKPDAFFYRCPCCNCRVKAFTEEIVNYV